MSKLRVTAREICAVVDGVGWGEPATLAAVLDAVHALTRSVEALRADVQAFTAHPRGRGPRDGDDLGVVRALAGALARVEVALGTPFRCRQILRLAASDTALRDALAAADAGNTKSLGQLFGRMVGVSVDGLCLTRGRSVSHTGRWRLTIASE